MLLCGGRDLEVQRVMPPNADRQTAEASKALMPASCCSRANVTSRIELAEATPTAMIAPNAS